MLEKLPGPIRDVVDIYFSKRVSRSAAALSFFMTLSIFPLLICVSAIFSSLNIDTFDLSSLSGFVPSGTIDVISGYLTYIDKNSSSFFLVTGIVVMITSSSAAFRILMMTMADIQGKTRFSGIWGTVLSFVMSVGFMAVIYLSCVVIMSGEWIVGFIDGVFGLGIFADLWSSLRFVILFLFLYLIINAVYGLMAPKHRKTKNMSFGAFIAAFALVVISGIFSFFISQSVKYTLVYGSLASMIILMMWLYICGIVLIMGNVINYVMYKYKKSVSAWFRSDKAKAGKDIGPEEKT